MNFVQKLDQRNIDAQKHLNSIPSVLAYSLATFLLCLSILTFYIYYRRRNINNEHRRKYVDQIYLYSSILLILFAATLFIGKPLGII